MKIVDDDAFLEMPASSQNLYFHLNMRADDDGFVDKVERIMRDVKAGDDDLKILIAKNFVIPFVDEHDRGFIVIKHWRMHNTLSKSRYTPTDEGQPIDDSKIEKLFNGEQLENKRSTDGEQVVLLDIDIDKDIDKELNNIYSHPETDSAIFEQIISHLNEKAGTHYKSKSSKSKSLIRARLNEGYTLEDFYKVIDKKSDEWLGTEFEKYLCPETLFCTKFEKYLNQKIVKGKKEQRGDFNSFRQSEIDFDELSQKVFIN